jgi:hypothetical protein
MMVIPTQRHVTLYYGRTAANTLGQTLEVIGWLLLVGISGWRFVVWRRRRRARKLVVAAEGAAPLGGPGSSAPFEAPFEVPDENSPTRGLLSHKDYPGWVGRWPDPEPEPEPPAYPSADAVPDTGSTVIPSIADVSGIAGADATRAPGDEEAGSVGE